MPCHRTDSQQHRQYNHHNEDGVSDSMLISGFTFARNTAKLGYPIVESIQSVLPICDEFVIALGNGDADDTTRDLILSINSPKIKIIDTEWKNLKTLKGTIYSQQTNIAKEHCQGTWGFYIQADEVIHERYLETISAACNQFADDSRVNGFLLNYKHFWGDYDHYLVNHRWYPREIRIIRNTPRVVSVGDAQSFRYTDGNKIAVIPLKAEVFHYGHVRDPRIIKKRITTVNRIFKGQGETPPPADEDTTLFDYGSLEKLHIYSGTPPAIMQPRVAAINWKHLLQYSGRPSYVWPHDRLKYRIITFIEQTIFRGNGREFWGNKVYKTLRNIRWNEPEIPPMHPPEKPAASLIIAVYNHADFLEKVFTSLKNQSMNDFEVIVADDGSGPGIKTCIDQFQGTLRYPIKHVSHEDDGFRKTIIVNHAVTEADADYCLFIDGDCILHHRFIEFHLKRKKRGVILSGRRVMMNKECSANVTLDDVTSGRVEHTSFWRGRNDQSTGRHGHFFPGAFFFRNLFKRKIHDILGSNFSVYKDDFLKINGYDERIIGRGMEDDNLAVRFCMAGMSVKTVAHEALQYHLYHTSKPIPHDRETIRRFRDNPEKARTPWGVVKEQ